MIISYYNVRPLSKLLQDTLVTSTQISDIIISEKRPHNVITSVNPSKAHGWDKISVRMKKMSDVALVTSLQKLFATRVIPRNMEIVNVVPVHKKSFEENFRFPSSHFLRRSPKTHI